MRDFSNEYFDQVKRGAGPISEGEAVRFFLEWRGFLVHQHGESIYLDPRVAPGFNPDCTEGMGDVAALAGDD